MTDYIDLGKPDVSKVRPGDLVTMVFDHKDAEPFDMVVQELDSKLIAGVTLLRGAFGDMGFAWERWVIRVRRKVDPLPTEHWSLVLPRNAETHDAFVLTADGRWRAVQEWDVSPSDVALCVVAGTHYVKGAEE